MIPAGIAATLPAIRKIFSESTVSRKAVGLARSRKLRTSGSVRKPNASTFTE